MIYLLSFNILLELLFVCPSGFKSSLLWMLTFLFYFYNLEIIVSRKRLGNQNITIVSERIK